MNTIDKASTLAMGVYRTQRAEGKSIWFSFLTALAYGRAVLGR